MKSVSGAVVEASDVRPETEEQIKSLGGKFIELPKMEEKGSGTGGYAREVSADGIKSAYRKAALNRFAALPPSQLELTERLEQLRLGVGHLPGG